MLSVPRQDMTTYCELRTPTVPFVSGQRKKKKRDFSTKSKIRSTGISKGSNNLKRRTQLLAPIAREAVLEKKNKTKQNKINEQQTHHRISAIRFGVHVSQTKTLEAIPENASKMVWFAKAGSGRGDEKAQARIKQMNSSIRPLILQKKNPS
jgi:hypothetical protein